LELFVHAVGAFTPTYFN